MAVTCFFKMCSNDMASKEVLAISQRHSFKNKPVMMAIDILQLPQSLRIISNNDTVDSSHGVSYG